MIEEEFKVRSERLGKRKNHKKEYALLKKILDNPYPMKLKEPLEKFPETFGWMYFNLENLFPHGLINSRDLTKKLKLLDKVVALAWNVHINGKKVAHQFSDLYDTLANRTPRFTEEIGINIGEGELMNYQQTKTILHYYNFNVPDYKQNLWEASKK